jgi:hypothetical protein
LDDWPFEDPENVVCLTTRQISDGNLPILLACRHAEEGMWQFLTSAPFATNDALFVSLGSVFEIDSSIGKVADLPLGWSAERSWLTEPWVRQEPRDEEQA